MAGNFEIEAAMKKCLEKSMELLHAQQMSSEPVVRLAVALFEAGYR